jgi:hypothetical protein
VGFSAVRRVEIHTAEPLVLETSRFEVEIAIAKLKSYTLPSIDHIPAELIQAAGETLCSEINKLIISLWKKEEFHESCTESSILQIYKKADTTDCSNYQLHT